MCRASATTQKNTTTERTWCPERDSRAAKAYMVPGARLPRCLWQRSWASLRSARDRPLACRDFPVRVYARDTYPVIYHEYAISRIVPMSYEARENVSFGPWVAPLDIGATDASDDGLITEWAKLYYVTHDWSEYGQQIRQMIPGDALAINGKGVLVVDIFDYPRDAYLEEIREIVGQDAVVLQTCEPGTPNNRIVWRTQT